MFVTIYSYRAREGCESAICDHHDAWAEMWARAKAGYLCSALLVSAHDPGEFMWLVCFEDEEAAWTAIQSAEEYPWYAHLVNLAERGPDVQYFRSVGLALPAQAEIKGTGVEYYSTRKWKKGGRNENLENRRNDIRGVERDDLAPVVDECTRPLAVARRYRGRGAQQN